MKKSMKFATALAGAAVVVVGGTAFTDGNSMIASRVYGFGKTTVTGAVVTKEAVNKNAADNSKIDSIVFDMTTPSTTMETGYHVTLQANAGDTDFNYPCTFTSFTEGTTTNVWTCATTSGTDTHQLLASELVSIGLTVSSDLED